MRDSLFYVLSVIILIAVSQRLCLLYLKVLIQAVSKRQDVIAFFVFNQTSSQYSVLPGLQCGLVMVSNKDRQLIMRILYICFLCLEFVPVARNVQHMHETN